MVIFLYRPWVYSQEDEDEGKAEIIEAKQRNGPTGKVDATFIKQYARFENLSDQETLMENPLTKFVPQLFGEYPKPFLNYT